MHQVKWTLDPSRNARAARRVSSDHISRNIIVASSTNLTAAIMICHAITMHKLMKMKPRPMSEIDWYGTRKPRHGDLILNEQ